MLSYLTETKDSKALFAPLHLKVIYGSSMVYIHDFHLILKLFINKGGDNPALGGYTMVEAEGWICIGYRVVRPGKPESSSIVLKSN